LPHGIGFQVIAPLTPRHEFRARRESRAVNRTGQRRTQLVFEKRRGIGHDLEDFLAQLRAVVSIRDVALDELVSVSDRLARGHAEENQVFGVHEMVS